MAGSSTSVAAAGLAASRAPAPARRPGAGGPGARPIYDRCLVRASGPPIFNPNPAGGKQIVQPPSEVVMLSEANHDVRIVRRNGRHPPNTVRVWAGDSIGH